MGFRSCSAVPSGKHLPPVRCRLQPRPSLSRPDSPPLAASGMTCRVDCCDATGASIVWARHRKRKAARIARNTLKNNVVRMGLDLRTADIGADCQSMERSRQ